MFNKGFEIDLTESEIREIRELIDTQMYVAFESYLMKVLEKNRETLEQKNDDLLRGECRRIRKILRLRTELPRC